MGRYGARGAWALAAAACALLSASAATQAQRIGKPRPAPPGIPEMPALPPAVIDNSLGIGGQEVKAREVETRLGVDVLVNGQGPYRFIVDSGADTSAIGVKLAERLGLPLATPVILNGMTSRSIVDRVRIDSLTMGPTTVRGLQIPALREGHLGGDGLLGIDTLLRQRLLLDFEKSLIRVEDPSSPERYEPGSIIITGRTQRGQLILTHVTAVGLPLDAVIDTGSQVTIGNLALRDKLLRHNRDKFVTASMIGVTGVVVNVQMATIAELQLGPIRLRNVPMAFADVPPFAVFGLKNQPALLLGTDILENFRRVSLDFKARKVRFQLRKCTDSVVLNTAINSGSLTRLSTSDPDSVCSR